MLNAEKSLSVEKLVQTRWAFGETAHNTLTNDFRFGANGRIKGFARPEETSWLLQDGILKIFKADGTLMWHAYELYVRNGSLHIGLKSPHHPGADFTLYECTPDGYMGFGGNIGLPTSAFLFPTDLQVTPVVVRKVLLIGSCLTDFYYKMFRFRYPDTAFDYILFNNAGDLPAEPPSPARDYDFIYLQIPLRTIVTDRVITGGRLNDAGFLDEILSDGFALIDAILDSGLRYNKTSGVLTLVPNFVVPQMEVVSNITARQGPGDIATLVRRLNEYLAGAIQRYKNVFLCNIDGLAASIGKRYLLDDITGFYTHGTLFHQDYTELLPGSRIEPVPHISSFYDSRHDEYLSAVWEQALATLRIIRQIDQVKAVIFDLDNTMWRGLIAEDYRPDHTPWPHGVWQNGIWEAIQHIRARGILVAICSKNDFGVVEKNWDNAVRPPFLKLTDFASVKINWKTKAENILAICQEFNIKPKSVVLVDDNPVEREAVRSAFPDIRTIGSNPYLTRRILLWAPEMQIAQLSTESAQRETSIRGNIVREQTRAVMSREEFLKSLRCSVEFVSISDINQPEFVRVVELTNKTNQFNTTGKRWSHAEIMSFLAEGGWIVAFRVKDKFSDYGLVGVLYGSGPTIMQFVMSCRVLGMEVEQAAIAHVVGRIRRLAGDGPDAFASLTETADNSPCREVFTRAGFSTATQEGPERVFQLRAEQHVLSPIHIEVGVAGDSHPSLNPAGALA